MPSRKKGSAAGTIQVTPESAESFRQQFDAARTTARRSAARLAAACHQRRPPGVLMLAADSVLEDAARLRGLAALVLRLP